MTVQVDLSLLEEALRRSEKGLEQLAQENAIMASIGRIIGSTLDINEVYERFAEEARKLIPFDRISVSIINLNERNFTNAYTSGVDFAEFRTGSVSPLAGSTAELITQRGTGLITQAETEREIAALYPDHSIVFTCGMQSKLSAPLISKDQVIGILHLQSCKANAYKKDDLRLAETIAAQIAGAIANAQLFLERKRAEEALRRSEDEAKRLAQGNALVAEIGQIISSTLDIEEVYERFAEKVRAAIPFERIMVNIVNMKDYTRSILYAAGVEISGNRIGEVLPLAGSGSEVVARTKSSLLVNANNKEEIEEKIPGMLSLRSGAQSVMYIPLISKNELIGTLLLQSTKPNAYSDSDLRLAEKVGNQIAGAIANGQLFLERRRAMDELQRGNDLLNVLSAIQSQFITDIDPHELFNDMLTKLLSLTQSEYGFIGEVLHTPSGAPYLKSIAITNIAWNEETEALYKKCEADGLEFFNLQTLFGQVMATGKPVISHHPAEDPRRGGLPEGHPPLHAFLGVPFLRGEALIGMAGMANRPNGYDEGVIAYMQPVLSACGNIVEAYRNDLRRKKAEDAFKQSADKLRKSLGATVQALAAAAETRDPYTAGHQRRVADLARAIATEMNLPPDQIDGLRMAGAIHDVGKISVPAEILSTPRKLADMEFNLIKTHARTGYDILKDIDFPWPIARMVHEHHERIDGSGYPNGLTEENILIESKIIAVADVVEAMSSHRPYRPGRGLDAALDEIAQNRGIIYDSAVVTACLKLFMENGYKMVD